MAVLDEPSRKSLPNTPQLEDHRLSVIKGAISGIPVLGGMLAEELGLVLVPPLTRRRDEWFEDLARRLHDLEGTVEGFHFEDLSRNEQFVSASLQATQAALRTHQGKKLEALRNAVLNTALGRESDENLQTLFLNLADRLTPLHLMLLNDIQSPRHKPGSPEFETWELLSQNMHRQTHLRIDGHSTFENPPSQAIRFFKDTTLSHESDELVGYLLRDLYVVGLSMVNPDNPYLQESELSELGIKFLRYISSPDAGAKG